jgi:hypothetical protein
VPSVGRIVGGCSATSIAVQPLPNPMGQLAGVAVNSQGQVLIGDAVGVTIYTYNVMKSGKLALDKYTIFSNNEVIWSFVLRPTNDKAASEDTVFVANTRIQGTGSGWDEYAYPAAQSPIVSVAGLHEAVGIAITPAHNALETW